MGLRYRVLVSISRRRTDLQFSVTQPLASTQVASLVRSVSLGRNIGNLFFRLAGKGWIRPPETLDIAEDSSREGKDDLHRCHRRSPSLLCVRGVGAFFRTLPPPEFYTEFIVFAQRRSQLFFGRASLSSGMRRVDLLFA